MINKSEVTMNNKSNVLNIISWLFGIAVFAIGVVNAHFRGTTLFLAFLSFFFLSFIFFRLMPFSRK